MRSDSGDITVLLERMAEGDPTAEEELLPQVYLELHRLALSRMRTERPGHTLQATALVHEAYLRLCRSTEIHWRDRSHFFRLAGRLMRRILVDYARQRNAVRRPRNCSTTALDEGMCISEDDLTRAVIVDEVLSELAAANPRAAQVVEMRFFGGMTEEEIAPVLGINARTIRRDWLMARAWLHQRLVTR